MNPQIAVRYGAPPEAPALSALASKAFRDTYRGLDSEQDIADYVDKHLDVAAFDEVLRDPQRTTLLADVAQRLAGYAVLRRAPGPACVAGPSPIELERFYLTVEYIGRGLGAQFMSAVCAKALRQGARTIWLGVYDRNVRAVAFYERCGFRQVGSKEFPSGGRIYLDPIYAVDLHSRIGSTGPST